MASPFQGVDAHPAQIFPMEGREGEGREMEGSEGMGWKGGVKGGGWKGRGWEGTERALIPSNGDAIY